MSRPGGGTDTAQPDVRLRWLRRGVWLVLALGVLAFLVKGADNPPDPVLVPSGGEGTSSSPVSPGTPPSLAQATPPPTTPTSPTTVGVTPNSTTALSGAGRAVGGSVPETPAPVAPAPPPTVPLRRPLPGFDDVAIRVTSAAGGTFDGVALLADNQAAHNQGLMEQTDLRGYDGMVFRFSSPSRGEFYMRNTRIPLSIAFFDTGGRFISSTDMTPCPDQVRDCPTYPAAAPYLHAIETAVGDLGRLGIGPGSVLSFPSP